MTPGSVAKGPVLIVGAGHAGFQVAASLRQHGFTESVVMINDEAHLPYQRPPLSKAYIKGSAGPESLFFRPEKFYVDQKIELVSDRAVAIDRAARKLTLTIKGKEVEEEKQAMAEFGSSDSGASLGDILGAAIRRRNQQQEGA